MRGICAFLGLVSFDHSSYFVASLIEDHIRFHAQHLISN